MKVLEVTEIDVVLNSNYFLVLLSTQCTETYLHTFQGTLVSYFFLYKTIHYKQFMVSFQ